jgi:hypothetical protein
MENKKHPCPDCRFCQWCSDARCSACLGCEKPCRKKLSMAEQIELYEKINREFADRTDPSTADEPPCGCKK